MESVREYHKIYGPFQRHTDGPQRNKLIPWEWTRPEFEYLQHVPWRFTEKVNGTNVRVVWDGHRPQFMGRTDRAQMPTRLLSTLQQTFTEELLEQTFGETSAILFGEGYGAGIQKGGNYRSDQTFILFDILINETWLQYADISDIGRRLGIETVPLYSVTTLRQQIWEMAESLPVSVVATEDRRTTMEGLVGTPAIPLLDRRGGRIIVKLKVEDIHGMALGQHIVAVPTTLSMAA